MGCINFRWRLGCWLLLIALSAGCASKGKPKESADAAASAAAAASAGPQIPNPYLAQDVKAPAATQSAFRIALVSMQSEDWEVAEKQLQDLAEANPQLSGPLVNLGIVYWRQDKLAEAEQTFTRALATNPLNNDAYIQFALFERDRGRFAEAEKLYLKAIDVWPHNAAAHRNLGILYDLYMGKFDAAMRHYEMVLKLSAEPNKEVEGWIADLKRRMAAG